MLQLLNIKYPKIDIESKSLEDDSFQNNIKYNLEIGIIENDENSNIFHLFTTIHLEGEHFKLMFLSVATFHLDFEEINKINDNEIIDKLKYINSPSIIFPFVRNFLADTLRNLGYKPFYLPSENFIKRYNDYKKTLNESKIENEAKNIKIDKPKKKKNSKPKATK